MIHKFLSKGDWYSIFLSSIFLMILVALCLIGKVFILLLLGLLFIMCCIASYFTFFKKYDESELDSMFNEMKDMLVGGKK